MNDKELYTVKQALQEYVNADNFPLEVNPRKRAAIAALEQQPAAREPLTDEPVAWLTQAKCLVSASDFQRKDAELYGWKALYTRPQPAAWVGFTEKEMDATIKVFWGEMKGAPLEAHRAYIRGINDKLREKNCAV